MSFFPWKQLSRQLVWLLVLVAVWLLCSGITWAGPLSDRLSVFPNWQEQPPVRVAEGDLIYPDWFAGNWQMTSTLVDMVAPLAPDLITPGFEGNRQYLHQPINTSIRFIPVLVGGGRFLGRYSLWNSVPPSLKTQEKIVADRAFNGLNLARSYLGENGVISVKVDPDNPNRQITLLKGNQQLISTVTGRATEVPSPNEFVTTEVFQQFFRGDRPTVYLNQVENTTAYHYHPGDRPRITANQVTAIYLSPQDPDYFKALNRPVALYHYQLEFDSNTMLEPE